MPQAMDPAVVLGLFDTGLAVVRGLARAGIQVFGFDSEPDQPGFKSRFGAPGLCPDPTKSPDDLVEFLLERARAEGRRPVLFPTSDAFVLFVSARRDALGPWYRYALPDHDAVLTALDKAAQYARAAAAGIPVPTTYTPSTLEEVERVARAVSYPAVVKPRIGHLWRERFAGRKALRFDDPTSLVAWCREARVAGAVVVQEHVEGPNSSHCKVCAYFDHAGAAHAVICMRKIRQYPVDFGVGTMMETVIEPEVRELGLRLFRALDWRGPGSIEFKRDRRDGRWKLIELNARLWQQHGLAAASGLDFPLIQYRELTGTAQACNGYAVGVRWMDEFRDPRSVWEHRRRGLMGLTDWARSLCRTRAWALWALDDPAPFLARALQQTASVWRRAAVRSGLPGSRETDRSALRRC